MSYSRYLKSHLADFLPCAVMALGLGLSVVQGFHIPDDTARNVPFVAAATAIPLASCYLVGYSKKTLALGIPALVIAAMLYALALSQLTSTPLFAEQYDNTVLANIVLLPVALVTFLLARTRAGIVCAFISGCVLCGAIQFLYESDLVAPTLAFMAACATLYLMKNACEPLVSSVTAIGADADASSDPPLEMPNGANEKGSLSKTSSAPKSHGLSMRQRLPRLAMSIGLALAAAGMGICVFSLIIAPLNPPARELKLITEYYSLEEVHVSGILSFLHQRNDELSGDANDEMRHSNATNDETQETEGTADSNSEGDENQLGDGSFDASALGDPLSIVRYFQEHWWIGLIILAALVAAWIALVVIRRTLRRRRLGRWRKLGPRNEYLIAFEHVCQVLERAGMMKRGSKTPLELAESSEESIRRLELQSRKTTTASSASSDSGQERAGKPGGVSPVNRTGFSQMAELFAQVSYGLAEPSEDELASAEAYVQLLPKRLAKTVGAPRYLKYFFFV